MGSSEVCVTGHFRNKSIDFEWEKLKKQNGLITMGYERAAT